jgi:hypothetical protein
MKAASLFYIHADGTLSQMRASPYDSEDEIQSLLATYPDVLAGEQYSGTEPRRWLLVDREVAVPDGEGRGGRWSLDHLYVDQDAIPTLVEVKRERDTRSRREVVGQMLDYAANGSAYWPASRLKTTFTGAQLQQGKDPLTTLQAFLGEEADIEQFWTTVDANMRSGRVRMIFVVDVMPPELLRIVEFLAHQLHPAEIYAVEVRHHTGAAGRLLATQVMGKVTPIAEASNRAKAAGPPPTLPEWLAQFRDRHGREAGDIADALVGWMQSKANTTFVTSAQTPSFMMAVRCGAKDRYPLYITGNGKAAVSLSYLAYSPAFAAEQNRQEVIDRIAVTIGADLQKKGLSDDVRLPIGALATEANRAAFLAVIDWIIHRMREAEEVGGQSEPRAVD